MKSIKFLALLLSLIMLFCLVSCAETKKIETNDDPESVEKTDKAEINCEIILIPQDGEKQIYLCSVPADESVKMIALIKENPDWGFSWLSDYFVERFAGAQPDSSRNEYIAIYTTDAEQSSGEAVEMEGSDFYYASLGITGLELKDGQRYLFRVENF